MKNGRTFLLSAAVVMVAAIILVSVLSVRNAPQYREGDMVQILFSGRAELRNTIEIPLSDLDSLVMEYGSKNIKVYASKDEKVTIKEYLYSNNPKAAASVSYPGDKEVIVTGGQMHSIVIFGFWGEGEKIEVYIPEKSLAKLSLETGSGNITSETCCTREEGSLSLHSGSGNIKWNQAAAEDLSFQAGSGNITLQNIKGNVSVQTGSGNVTGKWMEGNLAVRTGSGNITMTEISGGGEIEAGSGNVKVEAVAVTGDMNLTTGSGNIHLELPENLSFYFQAETGSGNINVDFDDALSYNKKGNYAEGEVGSGAPQVEIHVKANSGNVRVSN